MSSIIESIALKLAEQKATLKVYAWFLPQTSSNAGKENVAAILTDEEVDELTGISEQTYTVIGTKDALSNFLTACDTLRTAITAIDSLTLLSFKKVSTIGGAEAGTITAEARLRGMNGCN